MSDQKLREQRSKRLYSEEIKIKKRKKILSHMSIGLPAENQPHRLHKVSGMSCGNSNCVMCGNPRKFFNEPTIQEQRQYQLELWDESQVETIEG